MGGRLSLAKVRHLLISKANELGNPGATTEVIVDAVIKQYPNEVQEISDILLRSALGRELSRGRNRAPSNIDPTQATLWGSFSVSPQIIVTNENGERVNKNLDICTGKEVRDYANALPVRKNKSERRTNFLAMADSLKPFCPKEDEPLGAVWKKAISDDEEKAG